jgi:hypothetical protein
VSRSSGLGPPAFDAEEGQGARQFAGDTLALEHDRVHGAASVAHWALERRDEGVHGVEEHLGPQGGLDQGELLGAYLIRTAEVVNELAAPGQDGAAKESAPIEGVPPEAFKG